MYQVLFVLLSSLLLFSACSSTEQPKGLGSASTIASALEDLGWDELDGKELVDRLNRMPVNERPVDLVASVRANELVLTLESGEEETVPLPESEFYVSFAPYVEQTHPCTFHSLTTCLGEMRNAPVSVKITDLDSGDVLFEQQTTTFDNGFVGVWLPRDVKAELTVSGDGGTATVPISTHAEAPTCITTTQLT